MGMDAALARISEVKSYMQSITQRQEDLSSGFSDILDAKLSEISGVGQSIEISAIDDTVDYANDIDPFAASDTTSNSADLATLMQMSSLMGTSSLFDTGDSDDSMYEDTFSSILGTSSSSSLYDSLLGTSSSSSLYDSLLGTSSSSSSLDSLLGGNYSSLLGDYSSLLGGTSYSNDLVAQLYSLISSQTSSGAEPQTLGLYQVSSTVDFSGSEPYMTLVSQAAATYNLPENLILGVMKAESSFVNNQTSSAGAEGLMQLMPGTAEYLGVTDSMDPAQNINAGAKYLREMIDKYDGDVRMALCAYNTGPGNVDRSGATSSFSSDYQNISSSVRAYADKVLQNAGLGVII